MGTKKATYQAQVRRFGYGCRKSNQGAYRDIRYKTTVGFYKTSFFKHIQDLNYLAILIFK